MLSLCLFVALFALVLAVSPCGAQPDLEVDRLVKLAGINGVLRDVAYFGSAACSLGDVNGDGVGDVGVGASGLPRGLFDSGAWFVVFLNSGGMAVAYQEISRTSGNLSAGSLGAGSRFGSSCALVGWNLTGSGRPLVAVGANGDSLSGGSNLGALFLFELQPSGVVANGTQVKVANGTGGFPVGELQADDAFGTSVAVVQGLAAGGVPVLAVGAIGDDDGGASAGAVYLLWLDYGARPVTVTATQKISALRGNLTAAGGNFSAGSACGSSVASVGDLDGDGVDELAVGADRDSDGGYRRGAVHVLFLLAGSGRVRRAQKISSVEGGFSGPLLDAARFGTGIAQLGDADGDQINDLAVGAYGDDSNQGSLRLLLLHANGTVKYDMKLGGSTAVNGGLALADNDVFGFSIALLPDLNRTDGFGLDLAVGAFGDDGPGTDYGAVYVLSLVAQQPSWSTGLGTGGTASTTTSAGATTGGTTTAALATTAVAATLPPAPVPPGSSVSPGGADEVPLLVGLIAGAALLLLCLAAVAVVVVKRRGGRSDVSSIDMDVADELPSDYHNVSEAAKQGSGGGEAGAGEEVYHNRPSGGAEAPEPVYHNAPGGP